MNTIQIITLFSVLFLTPFSYAQDSPSPPRELLELQERYEEAKEKALSPIDRKYIAGLEKLKLKFTKRGDLKGALAVDAEINKHTAPKVVPLEEVSLEGTWLYRKGNATAGGEKCKIIGNTLIREHEKLKLERKGTQVKIIWTKTVHNFTLINKDTIRGKNHYGNSYKYVRVRD